MFTTVDRKEIMNKLTYVTTHACIQVESNSYLKLDFCLTNYITVIQPFINKLLASASK